MTRIQSIIFFAFLFSLPLSAQEYGTGEDSVECIKQLSLYRDFRDNKEYQRALPHWQKAVKLCPRASERLYVDGETFYTRFIEKTDDSVQKHAYLDSLMWVYDKWGEEYDKKTEVKGKKGAQLIKYRDWLPPKMLAKGNRLLKESVHEMKKDAHPPNVGRYFVSLYFLYRIDSVDLKRIALEYIPVSSYVDQNIRNPKNEKYKKFYVEKIKPKVDEVFMALTDCELLKKVYGRWIESDSAMTPEYKEKIMLALKQRGCKQNELYPKLAKTIHEEDPSPSSAYEIGSLEMDKGNNKEAAQYFQEAIDLLKKDSGKVDSMCLAEFYITAGRNANQRGLANEAQQFARQAQELDSESPWPYLIIAEAMASSSSQCGSNEIERKAVYWLAADYVKKAQEWIPPEDSSLRQLAQNRLGGYRSEFPGKDLMFTHQLLNDNGEPVDQPYEIGCWIGESVRPRKSW